MVATSSAYDFATIVDSFLAQKNIGGRHAAAVQSAVRTRALALLETPDVRYMPAFKILDLLAALTNIGAAIADAAQLRPNEVTALLRESLSEGTPLIHQFLLDAALERARYEPLMLDARIPDAKTERALILNRRWAAMRATHQEKAKLPDAWIDTLDSAAEHVLAAPDFQEFRQGPLLQLLAEMLALARKLHHQGEPLAALEAAVSERGALWRRYALKTARYNEKPSPSPDIRTLQPLTQRMH